MNPAEKVLKREAVYFTALIKEFKKKGYSYLELIEEEASTLILRSDKKQTEIISEPSTVRMLYD